METRHDVSVSLGKAMAWIKMGVPEWREDRIQRHANSRKTLALMVDGMWEVMQRKSWSPQVSAQAAGYPVVQGSNPEVGRAMVNSMLGHSWMDIQKDLVGCVGAQHWISACPMLRLSPCLAWAGCKGKPGLLSLTSLMLPSWLSCLKKKLNKTAGLLLLVVLFHGLNLPIFQGEGPVYPSA